MTEIRQISVRTIFYYVHAHNSIGCARAFLESDKTKGMDLAKLNIYYGMVDHFGEEQEENTPLDYALKRSSREFVELYIRQNVRNSQNFVRYGSLL